MHDTGKKLLNLMFRPGETVCVSNNKYGYHSIPLENVLSDNVTLVPTQNSALERGLVWEETWEKVSTDTLIFAALNPIKGFRLDENCYKFRNFLIEMDVGPLAKQREYIQNIKMPYSAAIFSGGKSIHFLISLDQDLPSEKVYRLFSMWALGIANLSDQNCQNPSRSIRIPGTMRDTGKMQKLLEFNGPVKTLDFLAWLRTKPECKPEEKPKKNISGVPNDLSRLSSWTKKQLTEGLDTDKGRNITWFAIACDFALAGCSEDDTVDTLEKYFSPDRDFKTKEWKASIRSAFKHVYEKRK